MIRKDGGPSWAVTVTNDMALNFALYVGCSYGFISKETYSGQVPLWPYKQLGENPDISLSRQWERWWTELIQRRDFNLSRGIMNPKNELFNPPEFLDLNIEGLVGCCKEAWPLFSSWWDMPAGGSAAMAYWESIPNVMNMVHKFERIEDRKAKDFKLHIDLVYTGISERLELRPDYVIMTLNPKHLIDETWWMKKLQQIG